MLELINCEMDYIQLGITIGCILLLILVTLFIDWRMRKKR